MLVTVPIFSYYPNRGIRRPGDFRLFASNRKNIKVVNADKEYLQAVSQREVNTEPKSYQVITYDR